MTGLSAPSGFAAADCPATDPTSGERLAREHGATAWPTWCSGIRVQSPREASHSRIASAVCGACLPRMLRWSPGTGCSVAASTHRSAWPTTGQGADGAAYVPRQPARFQEVRRGHRCRSKWKAVGIPPRFRFERFQFKEFRFERFRFEHGGLSDATRTLRPDVAVVAALADPGRAVLVSPRRPLLADAALPLLALTHLGESLPWTPSPSWLLAPPGVASGATELADAPERDNDHSRDLGRGGPGEAVQDRLAGQASVEHSLGGRPQLGRVPGP